MRPGGRTRHAGKICQAFCRWGGRDGHSRGTAYPGRNWEDKIKAELQAGLLPRLPSQNREWILRTVWLPPGRGTLTVPLTESDRDLLKRCLNHEAAAWNDFVDRYLGLVYHVVHHTAHLRSLPLSPEDTEDLVAEILLQLVANDYAIFRHFRGRSSLGTYLTVIARRMCIQELTRRASGQEATAKVNHHRRAANGETPPKAQVGLESLEEVQRLLRRLPTRERQVVRLFYLEGRSYEEISARLHIPVNSIGPILSRARHQLRKDAKPHPPSRTDSQAKPPGKP